MVLLLTEKSKSKKNYMRSNTSTKVTCSFSNVKDVKNVFKITKYDGVSFKTISYTENSVKKKKTIRFRFRIRYSDKLFCFEFMHTAHYREMHWYMFTLCI